MFSNNEYAELEGELKACEKANQSLIERNANLEAEVARLRESRVAQLREIERLEQRVAELERACSNECSLRVQATDAALEAQTALSSARKLLESADREAKANPRYALHTKEIGFDAALRLLRAHPEPATTAGTRAATARHERRAET